MARTGPADSKLRVAVADDDADARQDVASLGELLLFDQLANLASSEGKARGYSSGLRCHNVYYVK